MLAHRGLCTLSWLFGPWAASLALGPKLDCHGPMARNPAHSHMSLSKKIQLGINAPAGTTVKMRLIDEVRALSISAQAKHQAFTRTDCYCTFHHYYLALRNLMKFLLVDDPYSARALCLPHARRQWLPISDTTSAFQVAHEVEILTVWKNRGLWCLWCIFNCRLPSAWSKKPSVFYWTSHLPVFPACDSH